MQTKFPGVLWALFVIGVFSSPAGAEAAFDGPRQQAVEDAITRDVLEPWSRGWSAARAEALSDCAEKDAALPGWDAERVLRRERGGLRELDWREPSASDARASARGYLSQFEGIDAVDVRLVDLHEARGGDVRATLAFDLRGRPKTGGRRNDRGSFEAAAALRDGRWRLTALKAVRFESVEADAPAFADATPGSGLDKITRAERVEAIRRGGYALAVGDYDGDGRPDLLAGGSGPAQLMRNLGGGRYEDVTKRAGLAGLTMVKAAAFADMDGDGRRDLTIQRFVEEGQGELVFYRGTGDGFEKAPARLEKKNRHDRAMSFTVADLDGDGRLDLYVGYPGTRDFTDGRIDKAGGLEHEAAYFNRGGWSFVEGAAADGGKLFTEVTRPHSVLATDLDADGRTDLVVVDDRGNTSRLYLNRGKDGFAASETKLGLVNAGWGMTAAAGDYDNDGRQDFYFTNIDFTAGRRLLAVLDRSGADPKDKELQGLARLRSILQGNRLFRARADGSFEDVTEKSGLGWAGEAPAGAEWVDYDGDGLLDLYVTNGLWSNDPARDYTGTFLREQLAGADDGAHPDNPTLAILRRTGVSFAGYQRNRLFRNNGDGSFTEAGYALGADRVEDGYVAAVADMDGDGRPDLVLRNTDAPSLKRGYAPVVLLRNTAVPAKRFLAIELKPARGEPFGARVTLSAGGRLQTREIRAVTGAVQGEDAAAFGLGGADKADWIEVRWPSGRVDRHAGVGPGRAVIREGEADIKVTQR